MQHLRPIERRILAMRADGLGVAEIAGRLKRSPEHVERMIAWTEIPRSGPPPRRSPRPLERRVLALRSDGESHERIAERFLRSPGFIRRVEGLAHYTKALHLLDPQRVPGGAERPTV
jgi:DNA-binding CsgD family transcriptional regulator